MKRSYMPRFADKMLVSATVLLVLSACGGDSSTGLKVGPPAALLIVSGQAKTAVVGTELPQPLQVRVVDAEGNPVPGQIVNFRVTSGGGTVFAGASITSENGEARERWTLGTSTSQLQRLEARAIDPNTGDALVFGSSRRWPLRTWQQRSRRLEATSRTLRPGSTRLILCRHWSPIATVIRYLV